MAEVEFKPIYRCAGPKVEATEFAMHQIINGLLEGREKGTVKLTEDEVAQLLETRDEGVPHLFTIGQTFGLGQDGKAFIREECGVDVSDLIEAVPFDGEVHEITCPNCSTVSTVRRTPHEDNEELEP